MAKKTKQDAIRLADGDRAELLIYGVIGDFFDGLDALAIAKELQQLEGVKEINVRINSPGGFADDGLAIYNSLVRHSAKVVVDIEGAARSAASLVAMAGDEIRVAENADFMIHRALTITIGNRNDHEATTEMLDKLDGRIAGIYASRADVTAAEALELMDSETFFTADEAKEKGFVDTITKNKQAPENVFARDYFKNFHNNFHASMATWSAAALSEPHKKDENMNEELRKACLAAGMDAKLSDADAQAWLSENGDKVFASPPALSAKVRETLVAAGMDDKLSDDDAQAWLSEEISKVFNSDDPPGKPTHAKTTLSEGDVDQRVEAALAAENERCTKIKSLCDAAGHPELADKFLQDRTCTVEDVRAKLFDQLCKDRPAVGEGGGVDPDPTDAREAAFKKEYAENRSHYGRLGMTVEEYVAMRRVDEGLDVLEPKLEPAEA